MIQSKVPSSEVLNFVNDLVHKVNAYASELLKVDNTLAGVKILQRIEKLLQQYGPVPFLANGMNLTYNNLARAHKKLGNPRLALSFLETAILKCMERNENKDLVVTYLNASSVVSELGQHKQALEYAKKAAIQCQSDLRKATAAQKGEKASLLGIAYYNIGAQEEVLTGAKAAIKWYNKAIEVILHNSQADQSLKANFEKAKYTAEIKLQASIELPPFSPKSNKGKPGIFNKITFDKDRRKIEAHSNREEQTTPKIFKSAWKNKGHKRVSSVEPIEKDTIMERLKKEITKELATDIDLEPTTYKNTGSKFLTFKRLSQESDDEIADLEKLGILQWEEGEEQRISVYPDQGEDITELKASLFEGSIPEIRINEYKDLTNERNVGDSLFQENKCAGYLVGYENGDNSNQNTKKVEPNETPEKRKVISIPSRTAKLKCIVPKVKKRKVILCSDLHVGVVNISRRRNSMPEECAEAKKVFATTDKEVQTEDMPDQENCSANPETPTITIEKPAIIEQPIISHKLFDKNYEVAATLIKRRYKGYKVREYIRLLKKKNKAGYYKLIYRGLYKPANSHSVLAMWYNKINKKIRIAVYDTLSRTYTFTKTYRTFIEDCDPTTLKIALTEVIEQNPASTIEEQCNVFLTKIAKKTASPSNYIAFLYNENVEVDQIPTAREIEAYVIDSNKEEVIHIDCPEITEQNKVDDEAEPKPSEEIPLMEPLLEKGRVSTACATLEVVEESVIKENSVELQPLGDSDIEQPEFSEEIKGLIEVEEAEKKAILRMEKELEVDSTNIEPLYWIQTGEIYEEEEEETEIFPLSPNY